MTRTITAAVATALIAGGLLFASAPAQADRSDFPGPVHPCLQEPCPPAPQVCNTRTCFPSVAVAVGVNPARQPVRRPHLAHHH